jgi:hypothetical protein
MRTILVATPNGIILPALVLEENAHETIVFLQDRIAKAEFIDESWHIVDTIVDLLDHITLG